MIKKIENHVVVVFWSWKLSLTYDVTRTQKLILNLKEMVTFLCHKLLPTKNGQNVSKTRLILKYSFKI